MAGSSIIGCRWTSGGAGGSSPARPSRVGTWATSRSCSRCLQRAAAEAGDGGGEFDLGGGYLTPHSDVAALLVLDHQVHATNLITRLNWEARAGTPARVSEAADELVDYLLFVDEAPIPGTVKGGSGFAEAFAALGPHDARGRTLRQLRLQGRTQEYPLSYMIYTPMFEALPPAARDAVRARLGAVLFGRDTRPKYAHLTPALRTAMLEIVRATKPDLDLGRP